jgi:hypothetical protein
MLTDSIKFNHAGFKTSYNLSISCSQIMRQYLVCLAEETLWALSICLYVRETL